MKFHTLLLLLCLSLPVFAQTFRGEIRGLVEDPSGAILGDARIQVVNTATGFARTTLSGSSGEFSIPDLPPGQYIVTALKPGFQEEKSSVEVVVTRVATVNFRLPVATQASVVDVTASVASIETASTTLTGVVNGQAVNDLPMNGRDFRQMLKLSPGVNPVGNSINGNRTRGNNFQIDGADNNDGFQNAAAVNQGGVAGIAGTLLPIEAIDQFSVATNGGAEVGRNGGGVVNMVIKSGTNALHGSVYYFNRNEFFAANTPLVAAGAKVRRIRNSQGGFSTGGPEGKRGIIRSARNAGSWNEGRPVGIPPNFEPIVSSGSLRTTTARVPAKRAIIDPGTRLVMNGHKTMIAKEQHPTSTVLGSMGFALFK